MWTWNDLKNGGICLTAGKTTYLEDWLPKNMSVWLPAIVRATWEGTYFAYGWGTYTHKGIDREDDFSKFVKIKAIGLETGKYATFKDVGGQWTPLYPPANTIQWISAARSLALSFPDIYFQVTSTRGSQEIVSMDRNIFGNREIVGKYKFDRKIAGHQLIDKIGAVIQQDIY
jgi:hypothetical protein